MSTGDEVVLFGGFNFKVTPTEDTVVPNKNLFSAKKLAGEAGEINILSDLWVFEFKHASWSRPIVGGKHPRRSFKYIMQPTPGESGFKCVFISSQMKKNRVYELYSSGGLTRQGNLVHRKQRFARGVQSERARRGRAESLRDAPDDQQNEQHFLPKGLDDQHAVQHVRHGRQRAVLSSAQEAEALLRHSLAERVQGGSTQTSKAERGCTKKLNRELLNVRDKHKQLVVALMEEQSRTRSLNQEITDRVASLDAQTRKLETEKGGLTREIAALQQKRAALATQNKLARR